MSLRRRFLLVAVGICIVVAGMAVGFLAGFFIGGDVFCDAPPCGAEDFLCGFECLEEAALGGALGSVPGGTAGFAGAKFVWGHWGTTVRKPLAP
jgi:hypothetical protein